MDLHDDELGLTSGLQSKMPSPLVSLPPPPSPPPRLPARSAATPQAAPRWPDPTAPLGTASIDDAGEQPSTTSRCRKMHAELGAVGRRGRSPVPGQGTRSAAATSQSPGKNIFSSPGPMQAAMGDLTYVAVEAVSRASPRQSRTGPLVPVRAKPHSKGASKKELDIVIELPKNNVQSARHMSGTIGTVQDTSTSNLPPLTAARMPQVANETTMGVGELPPEVNTAAESGSAVQPPGESYVLRSISTTVETMASRLFARDPGGHQATSMGTEETDSTTRRRNPREICVDIGLRPPPESTASVRPITAPTTLRDSNDTLFNTPGAPKAWSLKHVVTMKSPRKRPRKGMKDEERSKMKRPLERAAAERPMEEPYSCGSPFWQQPPAELTATQGTESQESVTAPKASRNKESRKDTAAARRRSSTSQGASTMSSLEEDTVRGTKTRVARRASSFADKERKEEPNGAKGSEKHDDVHLDVLPAKDARKSSVASLRKSSLKRKQSADRIGEIPDEHTKRSLKKADGDSRQEIVFPESLPEEAREAVTEKDEGEAKKEALKRGSVAPTSPVSPISPASPEAAKEVPTKEAKKSRMDRRKSSVMTGSALTYSKNEEISTKETEARKGKKTSRKQSATHASLEAAKEAPTKEAEKKGKERRKSSMMKNSAPTFPGNKEISTEEATKAQKAKRKTSRKQSAAPTSLEVVKEASGQTEEDKNPHDKVPGKLSRTDARPVDTAEKPTVSEGKLHEEGAKHEMLPSKEERSPEEKKPTDAAVEEKVAPVISGDRRETTQVALTSDLAQEGKRKGSKEFIDKAATSKNAELEKLGEAGGLQLQGHVKNASKNSKAKPSHHTTEGDKTTEHLEKGTTDGPYSPPKSSLANDVENVAGREKMPKKGVLKKTKGQAAGAGKAIDLAEGTTLASEGVLQSCLEKAEMAAALTQGAELAKDDEEEEEAKAARWAMMRRRYSIAVHRVAQKKHKGQGPVAAGEPEVLQLGKHGRSPLKTESRPVAEGEPALVQLGRHGPSPDQQIESCPEKAYIAAALTPQGAAFSKGDDEEEEAKASRWEMMSRKDSIAVHRIAQQKHKGRGPVAEGEPAVLQLGKRVRPPVQKTEVQRPTDAGQAPKAGRLADTGLSPISSGQPRQKGRHKGRNRGARGAAPKERTRTDILRSPEGHLDTSSPRAPGVPRVLTVPQGGPLSPTSQLRNLSPMMHSPDTSSPRAIAVPHGGTFSPTTQLENHSPMMHSPDVSSTRAFAVPRGGPLSPTSQVENLSPGMRSPVMTAGSTMPRFLGPAGGPGGMPMGPMPPMGMVDMRGRMPRRRRRWRSRERKGPYAVGDSASKKIDPDKIRFSRIKMSPELQQAEGPPVLHAPIFDAGSSTSTPKGGSPASSMISHATPAMKKERRKSQPRDSPGVVLPDQGDAPGSSGDISPIADKVAPTANGTLSPKRKRSRKKRKGVLKRPHSKLKGKGGAMTVQELLKEIKQRKSAQRTEAEKGPKAGKSERQSPRKERKKTKKKAGKKKANKKTADTQTSFFFSEPETPAAMLESGDRGFCDFRFTVGLDRVVRGALSRNEFIGQQARRYSPHAASAADSSKGDASARIAPSEARGPSAAPAPMTAEAVAIPSESPQPQSDDKAAKVSDPRGSGFSATESKRTAKQPKKKRVKRSLKNKNHRKNHRKRASSVDDELKLLDSGTEAQLAIASTKRDANSRHIATLPAHLTESVYLRNEIGGDEPRVKGKRGESAVLQQKVPHPLPPLGSTTFTVDSVSPESPLKEASTAAEASPTAPMAVSLVGFLTSTAPETRSQKERVEETESPTELSTVEETTALTSEFLAGTATDSTSPEEMVSPSSARNMNRRKKKSPGASSPSSRPEARRGEAGVSRKPDRKSLNRSGRDERNERHRRHKNRKGEERSKRGQHGNRHSKLKGRGNGSPDMKDPGQNASKRGSPEGRSINRLVADASAPGNESPEKKNSKIDDDGNISRTRKSQRSNLMSSSKQASKIRGTQDAGGSGRKSRSLESKSPAFQKAGNKGSGKQGSGSPAVDNGTRRSNRRENGATNRGMKPAKRPENGRFEKSIVREIWESDGTKTLRYASPKSELYMGASRTAKPEEMSELESEVTTADTSPRSHLSAGGSDTRASTSRHRRHSSRERRQRRSEKKRRKHGKNERKGRKQEKPVRSPLRSGSGGREQPDVKVRSIDRIEESYLQQQQGYMCCFLIAGAFLTLLLLFGVSLLYFSLSPPSPPPFQDNGEPETQTYTLPVRTTLDYTKIEPEVTRIVDYCDTAFCSQEARYVESLFTSSQRPCVSFYEHVCDKWLSQQPKRPTGSEPPLSRDFILQSSLARRLLSLVQDSTEPDLQTAAKLYSSCAVGRLANVTSEDNTALEIMFERWEIRSWPRTDPKNISNLSVWRFAAELARDLDLATLFIVTVGVDPNDMGATVLELESPRPLFSGSDNVFEHEAKVYRRAVHETIASLDAKTSINVDDFANRLAKVSGVLRYATLQSETEEDFAVLSLRDLDQGVRHFIETLLANVANGVLGSSMKVAAKSPKYVRADLPNALLSVPPLDALNYMGLLVLVRVAPFLPEHLQALRTLFSMSVVGHTAADVTDTTQLCLWLVDRSLPGCFSKASHKWLQQEGHQDGLKQWLNHLESVFLAHVPDFAWMSKLSALLVRYRFKRRPVTQFGGGSFQDEDACAPEVPFNATVDHPLRFYLDVSTHRPGRRLRSLLSNSSVLRRQGGVDATSELRTEVTFDHALHKVHVPAALFNLSVPTNSSFFVFQLARVAVRFYRGLVQSLYENPFEREVPLRFTDESRRRLSDLASCFVDDAQRSPPDVRGLWSPPRSQGHWSSVGKPLLDQASALLLALRAFDELLHVRRIWKADDRLADLPAMTAQKLFFVYLALDNCEPTRTVEGGDIPALLRVNLPLRHVPQFAEAFNCSPADHMALSPGMWCNVLRSGAVQLAPTAERRRRGTPAMTHFGPLDGPNDGRPVA